MEKMKLLLGKTAKDMEKASYMSMWLTRAQETSYKELSAMENIEQILRTMDESEHQVCDNCYQLNVYLLCHHLQTFDCLTCRFS